MRGLFTGSLAVVANASLPPGPGPFGNEYLPQPVLGAARGVDLDGWKQGKQCNVLDYGAVGDGSTKSTDAIQKAIDDCGDLPSPGGTVLVPLGSGSFVVGSLWLRSNMTLRVEDGATLLGSTDTSDAPTVYTRRECVMMSAHAGTLNTARCLKMKDPLVGWDDCAEWSTVENLVIEGGGTIDANGDHWFKGGRERPMMLDLLWVNGLTLRDLKIRRPGFWTIHPTFSNNVRVTGMDVYTRGKNTDGIDPDSCWNVYIANNTFDTGDDCIAIKSGRDWSGRMVNISTQNVLAEQNYFKQGHGVSIGSETSGWVRNVTIRDSVLHGTRVAVRIKSCRGRGGGVENVLYQGLHGEADEAVQLTLNYCSAKPTNISATPTLHDITIKDMVVKSSTYMECGGIDDSEIDGIVMENVTVTGSSKASCSHCTIDARGSVSPKPCGLPPAPPPPPTPGCGLEERYSSAACMEGVSYGCFAQNRSMWTWQGCRGRFTCSDESGVECDSHGSTDAYHVWDCSACTVDMEQKYSSAGCAKNQDFGCYANGTMWVDHGCRGRFTCNGKSGVECNSESSDRNFCQCGSKATLSV